MAFGVEKKEAAARPARILFVDDDQMLLRAVEHALRGQPAIELVVATNAIDALLAVGTARPDLVVMDIYMPGLDGIEACRRIKANPDTRAVKVILTSATMTPDLVDAA